MKRATEGSAGHSGTEKKETRQNRTGQTERQMDKQTGDVDIDQLYTCCINARDCISLVIFYLFYIKNLRAL